MSTKITPVKFNFIEPDIKQKEINKVNFSKNYTNMINEINEGIRLPKKQVPIKRVSYDSVIEQAKKGELPIRKKIVVVKMNRSVVM